MNKSILKRTAKVAAILTLAFSTLALSIPAGAEGNVDRGKVKSYTCTGCHGIPGYQNAYPTYHVPKIGGQNYEYLVLALKAYKGGERSHPTMAAQAGSMTELDIEDIASYFVSLEGGAPKPELYQAGEVAAGQEKSVVCQACHGADGNGIDPQYPRLAGQYGDYLFQTLQAYRSGARNNVIMAGFASTLSDQDMKDLAAFYAAKEGLVDLKIK